MNSRKFTEDESFVFVQIGVFYGYRECQCNVLSECECDDMYKNGVKQRKKEKEIMPVSFRSLNGESTAREMFIVFSLLRVGVIMIAHPYHPPPVKLCPSVTAKSTIIDG